jgi:hypothetical protein
MNLSISAEQQTILDLVKSGINISINAVAGSGKTTTSLFIANQNRDKNILLLTYNAKLKLETRDRVNKLGLDNLEVHSYHAFCVKYLNKGACKDDGILRFLNLKDKTTIKPYNFDIIIVDEAQDMNPIYYRLLLTIIKLQATRPQLIVVGDKKQSIYQFNKADSRFLTFSHKLFYGIWQNASLSTSYRVTDKVANLINNCIRGSPIINSDKIGSDVRYLICDIYGAKPVLEVQKWLSSGLGYEDIFILAPSVRSEKSPVRQLANKLTELGVPIYVPTSDEEKLDEEILKGKIVFSTFHQVKGLERQAVLVYGIDASYFKYIDKTGDQSIIPNTIYVAITRSKDMLTLLHSEDSDFSEYIKVRKLADYCKMEVSSKFRMRSQKTAEKSKNNLVILSATELIKFMPVDIIAKCMEFITITEIELPKLAKLDIQVKTRQNDLVEGVAEINGVVVPSYFELKKTGSMTIVKHIENNIMLNMTHIKKKNILDTSSEDSDDSKKVYKKILTTSNTDIILKLATEWVCLKSGYNFKKSQIKKYDWMSIHQLQDSVKRLDNVLTSSKLGFEYPVKTEFNYKAKLISIYGFIDVLEDNENIWELKMTSKTNTEHFLQLAIYIWLLNNDSQHPILAKKTYLYNIISNKQYKIEVDINNLQKIIEMLLDRKLQSNQISEDYKFIEECSEIYSNV